MISTPSSGRFLRWCSPVWRAALFLLGLVSPLGAAALAADAILDAPIFSVEPAALVEAASRVPAPPGADVVVLLEEGAYECDARSQCTHRWTLVYRIVTEAGLRNWGQVDTGWATWYQQRPELRVRVSTPDGLSRALDPDTIEEGPAGNGKGEVYGDQRQIRAPLPALSLGAVVELQIVTRDHQPFFDSGITGTFFFGRSVPVRRARLTIDVPHDMPLRHAARLLPSVEPERRETGDRAIWTFEAGPLDAQRAVESNLPGDVPRWPEVAFATGVSWHDIAAHYAKLVDVQLAGAGSALPHVALGGAKGREATASLLLERLRREVRYTGVEFGDAAIVPRSPAEVLARKYGDCKDQASLLVAMLRAAGLSAHVALLLTGPGADVDPGLPGFGRFNHAIVAVDGPSILWIDPTDGFTRPGELPLSDAGRLALVASPDTQALVHTPETSSADNRILRTREFVLAERGPSRVSETTELWGALEREYRAGYADADPKKLSESRERYARSEHGADKVTSHEHSDPRDLTKHFQLHLEVSGAERGTTDEREAVVTILSAGLLGWLPEELTRTADNDAPLPEKRVSPYLLPEPYQAEWRYRIVPPPGFTPEELPKAESLALGPATLSREFSGGVNGVVTATLRLDSGRRQLSADEYEALRSGIRKLQAEPPKTVRFEQVGEAHLAAGRIAEALAEFRKLEAVHPKEALHHSQLAMALLGGGLGDAAREEARRAIAVEAGSTLAQRTLGWVLQHDALGRRFKGSFDAAGAEVAYRKAIELDPKDAQARGDLAILLEHNAAGAWRGPHARLAEAVDELMQLRTKLDDRRFDPNLLADLITLERFGEVMQLAEGMIPSPSRDACRVVALAATDGAAGALAKAASLTPDPAKRREVLQLAGNTLVNLRRYALGADVLAAASEGAPNAAALQARVGVLRRVRRHEDVLQSSDDPVIAYKRFLVALWLTNGNVDAIAPFFDAGDEMRAQARDDPDTFRRAFRSAIVPVRRDDAPIDVMVDATVSLLQIAVEGDDRVGYRLRIKGGAARDEIVFLVRRSEGYRFLGLTGIGFGPLGREVLRLADLGELVAARHWLDWLREDILPPGGDDLLAGSAFARSWKPGAPGGVDEIRLAAASLVSGQGTEATPAETVLLAARAAAVDDHARARVDLSLAFFYASGRRARELLPVAERLAQAHPESQTAFSLCLGALLQLERFAEGRKLAEDWLAAHPGDPSQLRALAGAEEVSGDLLAASRHYQQLVDAGRADAGDLNNLAWNQVVLGSLDEATVALARQAVEMSQHGEPGILHTLATVLAERGRTTEARQVLLEAMQKAADDDPSSSDWYVLGRIAEQLGAPDAATAAFRKVALKPHEPAGTSTFALAQRRLSKQTSLH